MWWGFQGRIAAVRWTSRCLLLTPSCSYSWVVQRSAARLWGQGNAMGKMTRNKQSQIRVWIKNKTENSFLFQQDEQHTQLLMLLSFSLFSTTLSQLRFHWSRSWWCIKIYSSAPPTQQQGTEGWSGVSLVGWFSVTHAILRWSLLHTCVHLGLFLFPVKENLNATAHTNILQCFLWQQLVLVLSQFGVAELVRRVWARPDHPTSVLGLSSIIVAFFCLRAWEQKIKKNLFI